MEKTGKPRVVGPDGRFAKGNRTGGRPRKTAERPVTARIGSTPAAKRAVQQLTDLVRLSAQENAPEILDGIVAKAKEDPRVGIEFLKMSTPPPARLVNLSDEVVNAPAEERVAMLVRIASQGGMDLAQCEMLTRLAQREYEAGVVRVIRASLIAVSIASKEGNTERVNELLVQLADKVHEMSEKVIEDE